MKTVGGMYNCFDFVVCGSAVEGELWKLLSQASLLPPPQMTN